MSFYSRPRLWSIQMILIVGNIVLIVSDALTVKIFFISLCIFIITLYLQSKKIEHKFKDEE